MHYIRPLPVSQVLEPAESARAARLRYVNNQLSPGIRRIGRKPRVRYVLPSGKTLRDPADLDRVKRLAIPPAWTDVWICPDPHGHIQATGRDARGRKQYRYHPRWREVRDEQKYGRLLAFAKALPRIRKRTADDMAAPGLPREKVLATTVQLLEKSLIRIGNDEYARQNGSVGLTTMKDGHARVDGARIRFSFKGKSGVSHDVDVEDRRLARIVKACQELPGQELFQYVDADGARQTIDSADVNDYIREITGEDFTAKDFRTWAGTVMAACALADCAIYTSQAQAKRNVVKAIESVAVRLGNTKAVCRKSYIHPVVVESYLRGTTIAVHTVRRRQSRTEQGLAPEERAVTSFISTQVVLTTRTR